MDYRKIIERRRALAIEPYKSLNDVGFDGPWVTPYQIASKSEDGPVLLALHWLDETSIAKEQGILRSLGYLPQIRFNKVIDAALAPTGLHRSDIYVTQAFHLIPKGRSEAIPAEAIDRSFDQVTRHELVGRKVIALGDVASRACARQGIPHIPVCHPSRRGRTNGENAIEIADALTKLGFDRETRTHNY